MKSHTALPLWSSVIPVVACLALLVFRGESHGVVAIAVASALLISSVIAAVHHAEVIAHRVGEPFGTLVLALAVTIIEVALIVSMMMSGVDNAALIARDTVFAAVMIVTNGVVGLCILLGCLRHRVQSFRQEGAKPALTVLGALSILTLVLPNFTVSTPGPVFNAAQLTFAGLSSLALYGTFVFIQTVRHRDYFLPVNARNSDEAHAPPPTQREMLISAGLLMLALVAVVGLAKSLSPAIRHGIALMGAPAGVVGIAISLLVLLPESVAALRAALANRLQTSLNLSLGSGLASIGLTIPTVAVVALSFDLPLSLGLDALDMALLALTLLTAILTLGTGRTTLLQGVVHLVIFAAYLFLSFVP